MKIQELFEQKGTKTEAGYQPTPKNGQKCINCTMWRDPNRCTAVEGKIDPNGWCKWYAGGAYGKRGKQIKEDGRIVRGVNTTVDIGVDQTRIEAAKFGNRVTRDGFPPTLKSNGKVNESLTAYQQAVIEGGHTLEDPRFTFLKELQDVELDERIRPFLKGAATAAAFGAVGLGGVKTLDKYNQMYNQQPSAISQPADTKPATIAQRADTKSSAKTLPRRPVSLTPEPKKSELAPDTSIRPKARPGGTPEPVRPKAKPSLKNLGKYSSYLYDEATRQGIKGVELIALMAQAAHETKGFTDLNEDGKSEYFNIYDPVHAPVKAAELGNNRPGDGEKYKGRGFLHITGKYNYNEVGIAFGMPFVKNPELLEDPEIAAKTSVWFWIKRVRPYVKDFSNVRAVTKPINKGLNKLAEREAYFAEYTELAAKYGEK